MERRSDGTTVLTTREARQAERHGVIRILLVSMVLAVVALGIVAMFFG